MKKLLFLIKFFLVKRSVLKYESLLREFDSLNKKDKINIINKKLNKLFNHAFSNSPYLREKYTKAGLKIDSIKTINDLVKIPYLTRQEIIDHKEEILTVKRNKNISMPATGGTTGAPMRFFRNNKLPYESFYMHYLKTWGLKPYSNSIYLWRLKPKPFYKRFLNKIFWYPTIKIKIDGTTISKKKAYSLVSKLNKYNPCLIQGYAGCLIEFSKIITTENMLLNYKPKAVWTTAAPLSSVDKQIISNAFNTDVYNEYGSAEIPWIAFQKSNSSDKLHVNNYARILEIIKKDNNGFGEVVLTDIFDLSFPKIRYRNGDKSKMHKTSTSFKTIIYPVMGRLSDYLLIPEIGKLDGSFLTTVFNKYPNAVKGFQFVQDDDFEIKFMVVPNYTNIDFKKQIEKVASEIKNLLKNKIKLTVHYVKSLKTDRGKTRYVIRNKRLKNERQ
jgi:phenylacetate-CoA ligase